MQKQNEKQETKRFERKPNFDIRAKLSKDGRFWIIERVETWILPARYLDVIAQNHARDVVEGQNASVQGKSKKKGERNANSNGQGN